MKLVDLFCGGGGFSLGAHWAGLDVAAAYDLDPVLTSSFAYNFPNTRPILADIAKLSGSQVIEDVAGEIAGVFGGPPCQGFSNIGRRDVEDPRRQLLGHFFRVIAEVRPAFFVMENVTGLAHGDARSVLADALSLVPSSYVILKPKILDAADFGAATRRRRLFVVGFDPEKCDPISWSDIAERKSPAATVQQAIGDLAGAVFDYEDRGFDVWSITRSGRPSLYARSLRSIDRSFTGHRPTRHTQEVIDRFERTVPGETDKVGRHPRLAWDGQCPTLRAGTGADRGSYQSVRPIHPDEPRVITVREGARLQGFPDSHRFHPTIWHSFRMIGNSVSPIIAKAIFETLATKVGVSRPARLRSALQAAE